MVHTLKYLKGYLSVYHPWQKYMKSTHRIVALAKTGLVWFRGLTPQQQPGSYQGGEMMMKSVFWWRKPEHPEETTEHCSRFMLYIFHSEVDSCSLVLQT